MIITKPPYAKSTKNGGVNAGVYGITENPGRKYVQIGQGAEYQFCKKNHSPFEAMFENGYYDPKFLLMAFLGNSAERWGNNPASASRDVINMVEQIPTDVARAFL